MCESGGVMFLKMELSYLIEKSNLVHVNYVIYLKYAHHCCVLFIIDYTV